MKKVRLPFPVPIKETISALIQPVLGKRGFIHSDIILKWEQIVGEKISALTTPIKVSKKTLHLRATSGAVAVLIEYQKDMILSKINFYYGANTITKIRIEQGSEQIKSEEKIKPEITLTDTEIDKINQISKTIKDEELSDVIHRLGVAIHQSDKIK